MFEPWTIIGWIILGIAALFVAKILLKLFLKLPAYCTLYIAHLKSKNKPLCVGQVWLQDYKDKLYIKHVYENGILSIHTSEFSNSGASWGESEADFRKRINNRHLILLPKL